MQLWSAVRPPCVMQGSLASVGSTIGHRLDPIFVPFALLPLVALERLHVIVVLQLLVHGERPRVRCAASLTAR